MKRTTVGSILFAALLGVTAHGQVITNYGPATYAGIPDASWNGTWDNASAQNISNLSTVGRWAAQTFIAPSTLGSTVYAYNFQLAVASATATFTTAIYEWTGTTTGAIVPNTSTSFSVTAAGFNPYGVNLVTNPGFGVSLTPGATYALVLTRTDLGTAGQVQYGFDTTGVFTPGSGEFTDGGAYRSKDGTTYTALTGADMAFWISFDPASLSPVPEPAVNGAIIGGLFVAGLMAWRRYGRKPAVQPPAA